MDWQGWLTLGVVIVCLVALVREVGPADVILMGGLFTLAVAGVLTPRETFAGFSNQAMLTVGALFMLSAALRDTGVMEAGLTRVLGHSDSERGTLLRLTAPLAGLSAFLNNAPIVAAMTPVVIDWTRRHGFSPSRFLIPLSYCTILGSTTTLIGTSVNLTVAGLMLEADMAPMAFFELLPVGAFIVLFGLGYLVVFGPRGLPHRQQPTEAIGERRREYTATMIVEEQGPLVGRSIAEAGLRHLPGLFLVEIEREGRLLTPVSPDEVLEPDDRLVFAGVVSTIVDLQQLRGLRPATEEEEREIGAQEGLGQHLIEAVVSGSSPLIGSSIRDASFRTVYDAAVIGVHRNGERLGGKIGDVVLSPGDTLLLRGGVGFLRAHRNSPDFYLVSEVAGMARRRYDRAWVAVGVYAAMVAVVTAGLLPISIAAFAAAGVLIAARCVTATVARRSVEWSILIVIAAGLGIATAMQKTGAATAIAHLLVASAGSLGPVAVLAVVYLSSSLMAESLQHNAGAAIMFPIAVAAAHEAGVDPRGFVMAVALGSTCSFASPVAYQTHLIVYGPGGYRFTDFVRFGLPLDLLCAGIAIFLIPRFWSF